MVDHWLQVDLSRINKNIVRPGVGHGLAGTADLGGGIEMADEREVAQRQIEFMDSEPGNQAIMDRV
jgi:hypothetical protein